MHALLKGRGTIPAGLTVNDLEATFAIETGLDLAWTAGANEVSAQAQLWQEGASDRGDWASLPLSFAGDDAQIFNTRVRLLNSAGKFGPASNICRFTPFTTAAVRKDYKSATYIGAGNAITALDLDSLDGGALNRAAGDLIVITAHVRSSTNNSQPAVFAAITGWSDINSGTVNNSDLTACRSIYKISTGDETTIQVLTHASAVNDRINYHVACFSIVGNLTLGDDPTVQITTANPAAQTLPCGDTGDARIAISSAAGSSSSPNQTFTLSTGLTIDHAYSNTTTQIVHSRFKARILTPNESMGDITTDQADNGVNSFMSFYFQLRP